MPHKKPHHPTHTEHREPKTDREAWQCLVSATVFFFQKRPLKMVVAVILFFGAPGIVCYDYLTTDRVKVSEAKPISEEVRFHLTPQAVAGEPDGPPILFDGNLYGYEDTLYTAKVLQGTNVILVYDKRVKKVWKAEFYSKLNKMAK